MSQFLAITRPARQPRAILFDLDGTLEDRAATIARYVASFHGAFGERLAGMSVAELVAQIQAIDADASGYRPREQVYEDLRYRLPSQTPPDLQQLMSHWLQWFPRSTAPRLELAVLLDALRARGILLGVVTNGSVQIQQTKLEQLGIATYLSAVVISEAVGAAKPDPRIFLRALALVGCSAADAWFIGDHPVHDVLGASAAGLRGIWLRAQQPWPAEHPEPEWQLASLADVLALLGPPVS